MRVREAVTEGGTEGGRAVQVVDSETVLLCRYFTNSQSAVKFTEVKMEPRWQTPENE